MANKDSRYLASRFFFGTEILFNVALTFVGIFNRRLVTKYQYAENVYSLSIVPVTVEEKTS